MREVFVGALGGTPESDGAMKASKLTMPLALLLGVSAQNFGGGGMGMDDGGADEDGMGMDGGGIIPSVRAPPCFWTSPGGSTFNLQGMKQLGHDFTGTTAGGYTYRFNMCGGTVKVCNRQPAPASKWRGTKCNNLGDMQTQEISLLDEHDASKGLRLVYRDGDICKKQVNGQVAIGSRQVTYEIECDRGSDPGVLQKIVETSMCDYTILFKSRHACPTNGIAGSRGWSFVFFVVLVAGLYLGIGIGINKYKFGLDGIESVPHISFWRQVPGLVKDGVTFSVAQSKQAAEYVQQRYLRK